MKFHLSIKYHIAGLVLLLNLFILACVAGLSGNMFTQTAEESLHQYVMVLAESVASMPLVQEALLEHDSGLKAGLSTRGTKSLHAQTIVEELRTHSDASYIVVMNMDAIRLTHPVQERIGKPFVGGDEADVFAGKRYVSRAVGTLGASLRAFVPILYHGRQIGAVSVGILSDKADRSKYVMWYRIILLYLFFLPVSITGSFFLASRIKKKMHDFEPEEIAKLLWEHQMVIESVKDAIVAVDMQGMITVINSSAKRILKLNRDAVGSHIDTVLPNSYLEYVLTTGEEIVDTHRKLGGIPCLVNVQPIVVDGQRIGALACFRDKSEAHRLAEELTGVRKFTDDLRAQAHEFSNLLHTLLGLLHFKEYEKAEALILEGSELRTQTISLLETQIGPPVVRGLLYGKLAACEEKKITVEMSIPTTLQEDTGIPSEDITLVLGNLMENAIESLEQTLVPSPSIRLCLYAEDNQLVLSVTDNGRGVPEHIAPTLFTAEAKSGKIGHRGLGLRLVKKTMDQLGGSIVFTSPPEGGVTFTATFPLSPSQEPSNGAY